MMEIILVKKKFVGNKLEQRHAQYDLIYHFDCCTFLAVLENSLKNDWGVSIYMKPEAKREMLKYLRRIHLYKDGRYALATKAYKKGYETGFNDGRQVKLELGADPVTEKTD